STRGRTVLLSEETASYQCPGWRAAGCGRPEQPVRDRGVLRRGSCASRKAGRSNDPAKDRLLQSLALLHSIPPGSQREVLGELAEFEIDARFLPHQDQVHQ